VEASRVVLSLWLTALIHVVHLIFVVYLPFPSLSLFSFPRIAMAFVVQVLGDGNGGQRLGLGEQLISLGSS
jgi:hypothetical protein